MTASDSSAAVPDVAALAQTIRRKFELFVSDGYRDEDGVWHDGPHRAEADTALAELLALVERPAYGPEGRWRELRERVDAAERDLAYCRPAYHNMRAERDQAVARERELREASEEARRLLGAFSRAADFGEFSSPAVRQRVVKARDALTAALAAADRPAENK